MHRNTLVYRLEKIKKLTGLDLREFDDAIVFKVALMVKKYLSNNPGQILIFRCAGFWPRRRRTGRSKPMLAGSFAVRAADGLS